MILVTGGAGFIGSHTCVALSAAGYDVLIADNFSNSSPERVDGISEITGKRIPCVRADVCDRDAMEELFSRYPVEAVIHFAGFKAVGESVAKPLEYYRTNIDSALTLCGVMSERGVRKLIFSSSATVYRADNPMPLDENALLGCQPLWMVEADDRTDPPRSCPIRPRVVHRPSRYFNPIGAHESGIIGEDPSGIPNNLFPFVSRVASGEIRKLHVFGSDYPTPDGTGVRDYIHVMDLAEGHVRALGYISSFSGVEAFNLGTGKGTSVLELVRAFEKASGRPVPYVLDDRRPGDIAVCYANTGKAEEKLQWKARYGIGEMCRDGWNWEMRRRKG